MQYTCSDYICIVHICCINRKMHAACVLHLFIFVRGTIIRKARNHCQDVDNCGDEDQYHLGIDHSQTGNHCQDREHCQNGKRHADQ